MEKRQKPRLGKNNLDDIKLSRRYNKSCFEFEEMKNLKKR